MSNRGNTLKVTAVLVLSALALTGFSTGRGHGGGSRHGGGGGGGGGGCSSSNQDHDSSSSSSSGSSGSSGSTTSGSAYDDDDDAYGSSGAGSSTSGGSYNRPPTHDSTTSGSTGSSGSSGDRQLDNAKVKLVTCATEKNPYAAVKVTNGNAKSGRFWVSVTFVDADGITVIEETEEVKVSGKGQKTTRIEIGGEGLAASVARCEVDPQAVPVAG